MPDGQVRFRFTRCSSFAPKPSALLHSNRSSQGTDGADRLRSIRVSGGREGDGGSSRDTTDSAGEASATTNSSPVALVRENRISSDSVCFCSTCESVLASVRDQREGAVNLEASRSSYAHPVLSA